jgi:hypothetical protein
LGVVRNLLSGMVMVALSIFGAWYVARFLWIALSRGFVPGKLGAIHLAWSVQYTVSVAACVLGLVFFGALIKMGLGYAGIIRPRQERK